MLKRLYLQHFRNYVEAEISFSPGVNWFVGKNAQGKTNLLEAIYLLSCGRSFRSSQLQQLIQTDAPFFYIEAEFEQDGVSQTLKVSFDGETKKVQHNATNYAHFSPLIGLLPQVLYAPEDIALVSGTPAYRRKFLDLHLSQMDPLYLHHLARYHKAMRQRNELLKKKSEVAIEPWEQTMAHSAVYLIQKRSELIEGLAEPLKETLLEISGEADSLGIRYQNSMPFGSSEELYEQFARNRKKELHIGMTLNGPHRDDLRFAIDDLSAKSFASVGQKHSIIAALRLCAWEDLRNKTEGMPFFSVDDFGAHLDRIRQKNFEKKLQNLGQIFLTSPNSSEEIFPNKQVIEIDSGLVKK